MFSPRQTTAQVYKSINFVFAGFDTSERRTKVNVSLNPIVKLN